MCGSPNQVMVFVAVPSRDCYGRLPNQQPESPDAWSTMSTISAIPFAPRTNDSSDPEGREMLLESVKTVVRQ